MQSLNNVNYQELTNLYQSDEKARAIFDLYSHRQRGRQTSSTQRIRRVLKDHGVEMSTKELSDFYLKMQKAGVGRCVAGRKGRVNRFIWNFHLKSVAEAAQGKADGSLKLAAKQRIKLPKLTPVLADTVSMKPEPRIIAKASPKQPAINKITVRRAGFEIDFPLDMTDADWKDVSVFLNNLKNVD